MHRISNQNKNRNGDFKMNKAVIYFGATGNEAADQMVMQVLEEYCTVNGYEVVAVISENARPEGMTFPMKFAFVGMAEVEDVWCQLYFVQVLRKEPLNIENRIGHAYPTSLYRLVYDRVAESHFVR